MKIVYISNSIIPSRTANSVHVMKMCSAFSSFNNEVILLAPKREKEKENNVEDVFTFYNVSPTFKIVFLPYPNFTGRSLIYANAIKKELKKIKPDFIYGRFLRGCYFASKLKIPMAIEFHAPLKKKGLEGYFEKKILQYHHLKKVIVISEALKNIFIRNFSINESSILVAHDGADVPNDVEGKNSFNFDPSKFHVGYVGNLYPGKGMEVISNIAPLLLNQDIIIHVVGGNKKDIEKWQSKINDSPLIFHGFVPQNKLSFYLSNFDICLLPNQKYIEGYSSGKGVSVNISSFTSPLKMFEYMAWKKPIIASKIAVLEEVLSQSNSILVSPEATHEWIKAIVELKNNAELRNKIAHNAYADFTKKYTWKKRAENILNAI